MKTFTPYWPCCKLSSVIIRRPSADNLKSCATGFRLPVALSGFVAVITRIHYSPCNLHKSKCIQTQFLHVFSKKKSTSDNANMPNIFIMKIILSYVTSLCINRTSFSFTASIKADSNKTTERSQKHLMPNNEFIITSYNIL